ncbi:hypothetical protein EDC04DRAFT_2698530 [Pisolithus marmoratus]|nr:hypothetical protein EDC04DRAFT_2698530 [Pisolithus marmoratus]
MANTIALLAAFPLVIVSVAQRPESDAAPLCSSNKTILRSYFEDQVRSAKTARLSGFNVLDRGLSRADILSHNRGVS